MYWRWPSNYPEEWVVVPLVDFNPAIYVCLSVQGFSTSYVVVSTIRISKKKLKMTMN